MKAAFIEQTGSPDVIKIGDLPTPDSAEDHLLVKVDAVSVNPIDTYIRKGAYNAGIKFPFVIGRDMVGTVAQTCDADRFSIGDRVWCNNQGYAGRQGTFAEFISIHKDLLYLLPPNVDALNAVASAHSALTSVVGLLGRANLKRGETLFINGGSGNVGTSAIQLARSIGARIVVTAGSNEKGNHCLANGADIASNYKTDDVVAVTKEFAPDGVDVYWDLSPTPDLQKAFSVIRPRGRILVCSGLRHEATLLVGDFYTRNCSMFGFTVTDLEPAELSQCAARINEEFKRGTFTTTIARTFPLSGAAEAHRLMEEGSVDGKIVLQVNH